MTKAGGLRWLGSRIPAGRQPSRWLTCLGARACYNRLASRFYERLPRHRLTDAHPLRLQPQANAAADLLRLGDAVLDYLVRRLRERYEDDRLLLDQFEATFRNGPYKHWSPTLGNQWCFAICPRTDAGWLVLSAGATAA